MPSFFALLSALLLGGSPACAPNYFPQGLFYEDPELDTASAETVKEYLEVAGEAPLDEGRAGEESYRITWLPNFDPGAVVRMTKSGGAEATVARFLGVAPEDGAVIRTAELSDKDWEVLRAEIREADFWGKMASEPVPRGQVVLDGSLWVLEGVRDGNYKAVQRVFPRKDRKEDAAFLRLSLAILRLSKLDIEESDLY